MPTARTDRGGRQHLHEKSQERDSGLCEDSVAEEDGISKYVQCARAERANGKAESGVGGHWRIFYQNHADVASTRTGIKKLVMGADSKKARVGLQQFS